ncbi:DUF1109 domain-containing protein [Mesorhizobium sp.]|uniref:DUF1109 domain-containing protein n=1 Tax=Mesorhizobium sp. TaxID=1871066 RepID=UPI0025C0DFA6|nr:DUF1109 domain-containing protein [Mesorhizobium sp.]
MKTDELIQCLARQARPIRSLPAPWWRAVEWLSIALPAVAVVALLESPRDDLAEKLADIRFVTEQAAALASAATAAAAAFAMVIPGEDRKLALLPVASIAVWLGSLGQTASNTWLGGSDAFRLTVDWGCVPGIIAASALPGLAMIMMLRRGVPLAPHLTMALGAFASTAVGDVGLRLFHPQDAGPMVLIWQFGSVMLLSGLAAWAGRRILD